MHIAVHASSLDHAGYPSLIDGLNDLALRRVELDVVPPCDVPRLGADEPRWVSIAEEGPARAYRQHLYEHSVLVSALRLPLSQDGGEVTSAEVRLAVEAADIIGAPVVGVEVREAGASAARLQGLEQQTCGMRALLAFSLDSSPSDLGVVLSALDEAAPRAGLALDVDALFTGAPSSDCAYDSLRALAPYVRCVTCGLSGGAAARTTSLADSAIDYARVAHILGNAGYSGALTIALAGGGDAQAARRLLRADAAYLKDIIGEL